jgi:hypothetical protein
MGLPKGWLLVAGYWLLVAGCWLLVAGCWLLVAKNYFFGYFTTHFELFFETT